jgi:hypothetical protein
LNTLKGGKDMPRYKYFVSFKSEAGDGNGVVTINKQITGTDDIRFIEKWIKSEKDVEMVTLNNFILLGVEE